MNDIDTGTVRISGLSELDNQLQRFAEKIQKNILSGSVRAGANVIRREAQQRATRATISGKTAQILSALLYRYGGEAGRKRKFGDQEIVTPPGFMRDHIAAWKSRSPYAVTYNVGVYGYKERFTKFFAFYWRFIEFGTSTMAAKPFLRPAFEGKKVAAVEAMRDYLDKRIDKEAKKQVSK